MKLVGCWFCAVSALALTACGERRHPATHQPVTAATVPSAPIAAPPQPAAPALAPDVVAPAPASATPASSAATATKKPAVAARGVVAARDVRRQGAPGGVPSDDADAALLVEEPGRSPNPHDGYSAAYSACMSSAHGFTAARADCYSAELAKQSERLDRAYRTAVAGRSSEQKARLLQSQRAWLKLRDSKCQDDATDDAADILHESSCRLALTMQRAAELERLAG